MDTANSNAPWCADTGTTLPQAGVVHLRTRLTANFTVIANALAQRRGSAVTVGVAAYILSLPDGAAVSIAALCQHFTEGEILISRALRELESAGYLERRRERGRDGKVRTRTFARDVPGQGKPRSSRTTPKPPAPPAPTQEVSPEPSETAAAPDCPDLPADSAGEAAPPVDVPLPEPDPQAAVILASLRISDRRLILSRREIVQLAPAVAQWLGLGLNAQQITETLTANLPGRLHARPARILAFRLTETPTALPELTGPPSGVAAATVLPWQTCEGPCERPFKAAEPGRCRDCLPREEQLAATG
jgi:hypothetical protein